MSKETTKLNKMRRAETRENRLLAASRRRLSRDFTIPMNAMVEIRSLPSKTREKLREEFPYDIDSAGMDVMIPDPKRGMLTRGRQLAESLKRREIQAGRINKKREVRRRFAKMGKRERIEARAKGDKQFVRNQPGFNPKHFEHCAPKRLRNV